MPFLKRMSLPRSLAAELRAAEDETTVSTLPAMIFRDIRLLVEAVRRELSLTGARTPDRS